jgi:hypothetical protein
VVSFICGEGKRSRYLQQHHLFSLLATSSTTTLLYLQSATTKCQIVKLTKKTFCSAPIPTVCLARANGDQTPNGWCSFVCYSRSNFIHYVEQYFDHEGSCMANLEAHAGGGGESRHIEIFWNLITWRANYFVLV